jgi:uncharacterized membrane protein
MLFGVSIGLASAVMQSAAYIFSRRFVNEFHSSVRLVIYSQLLMGIFGFVTFAATFPFVEFPRGSELVKFSAAVAVFTAAYHVAFYCFFKALNEIEASRLSSLLGLKVAVIALLTWPFAEKTPGVWHYVAILLTVVSAVGMNFSGMRIGRKGALYLVFALLGFATTDITGTIFVKSMPGDAATLKAICATSLAYMVLGIIATAVFLKMKFEPRMCRGALPYSVLWFAAMLILFASFGIVGVVFGSVIQASRGVVSVVFGILLARTGYGAVEPDVPLRVWVRRAVMAVLMVFAIGLYSWASVK